MIELRNPPYLVARSIVERHRRAASSSGIVERAHTHSPHIPLYYGGNALFAFCTLPPCFLASLCERRSSCLFGLFMLLSGRVSAFEHRGRHTHTSGTHSKRFRTHTHRAITGRHSCRFLADPQFAPSCIVLFVLKSKHLMCLWA